MDSVNFSGGLLWSLTSIFWCTLFVYFFNILSSNCICSCNRWLEVERRAYTLFKSRGSVAMASEENMTFKSYQNTANLFVKQYFLADSLIPYTSVISGMLVCKMVSTFVKCCHSLKLIMVFIIFNYFLSWFQVFDLTQLIGSEYFKIYSSFSKVQRIEWNNRWMDTIE